MRLSRTVTTFLATAVTLALTGLTAIPAHAGVNDVPDAAFDAAFIQLVNAERKKSNLPPLQEAPRLRAGALAHSVTMSEANTLYHSDPEYRRVEFVEAGCVNAGGSENVQRGSLGDSPEFVFSSYMASPPHRAAIMNSNYRYIASGTIRNSQSRMIYNAHWFAESCTISSDVTYPSYVIADQTMMNEPGVQFSIGLWGTAAPAGTTRNIVITRPNGTVTSTTLVGGPKNSYPSPVRWKDSTPMPGTYRFSYTPPPGVRDVASTVTRVATVKSTATVPGVAFPTVSVNDDTVLNNFQVSPAYGRTFSLQEKVNEVWTNRQTFTASNTYTHTQSITIPASGVEGKRYYRIFVPASEQVGLEAVSESFTILSMIPESGVTGWIAPRTTAWTEEALQVNAILKPVEGPRLVTMERRSIGGAWTFVTSQTLTPEDRVFNTSIPLNVVGSTEYRLTADPTPYARALDTYPSRITVDPALSGISGWQTPDDVPVGVTPSAMSVKVTGGVLPRAVVLRKVTHEGVVTTSTLSTANDGRLTIPLSARSQSGTDRYTLSAPSTATALEIPARSITLSTIRDHVYLPEWVERAYSIFPGNRPPAISIYEDVKDGTEVLLERRTGTRAWLVSRAFEFEDGHVRIDFPTETTDEASQYRLRVPVSADYYEYVSPIMDIVLTKYRRTVTGWTGATTINHNPTAPAITPIPVTVNSEIMDDGAVWLEENVAGTWKQLSLIGTAQNNRDSFSVTLPGQNVVSTRTYRVRIPATTYHREWVSPSVTMRINYDQTKVTWNSATLTRWADAAAPTFTATVSGTPGRTAHLIQRVGTTTKTLASARTNSSGVATFTLPAALAKAEGSLRLFVNAPATASHGSATSVDKVVTTSKRVTSVSGWKFAATTKKTVKSAAVKFTLKTNISRTFYLQKKSGSSWVTYRTLKGSSVTSSIPVSAKPSKVYWRVYAPATAGYKAWVSSTTQLVSEKKAVTVSGWKTAISSKIKKSPSFKFKTSATGYIQQKSGSKWKNLKKAKAGWYTFAVPKKSTKGKVYYRFVVKETSTVKAYTSKTLTVTFK